MKKANLQNADLKGADLRFTDLTDANLTGVKLEGACYVKGEVKGEKDTVFPAGFNPDKARMVAIAEDKSNPNAPGFEPCSK